MSSPDVEIDEELYERYVQSCKENNIHPTLSDYQQWRYEELIDEDTVYA